MTSDGRPSQDGPARPAPLTAAEASNRRGLLHPGRLPVFDRLEPPRAAAPLARWFWIARWSLPDGEESIQSVISYPALNLVVQRPGVTLAGPTTRLSQQTLTGSGWVIGAQLRPAAVRTFGDPTAIVDQEVAVDCPGLHDAVVAADPMNSPAAAAAEFADWLVEAVGPPDDEALLVDRVAQMIDADPELVSVVQVADAAGVSVRTLQRLSLRYIGLTPLDLIRRRRLQEAADQVRSSPDRGLADIAAEAGFTDHAHLTREFRRVLGFTPSGYRADLASDQADN